MLLAYFIFDDSFHVRDLMDDAGMAGLVCLFLSGVWWLAVQRKKKGPYPYGFRLVLRSGVGLLMTVIVALILWPRS